MPERKINLYGILESDEELFQDVIDGELSYTIAKSVIYGWMKEAIKQALELAAINIKLNAMETYGTDIPNCWDIDSITNTLNQIE